jgi:spore coat protein U-like protein
MPAYGPASAASAFPAPEVMPRHAGCIAAVTGFSFAGFSPFARARRFAVGYVTFACASPVAAVVLTAGDSGQFRTRRMSAARGEERELSYNIFLDAGRTQIFGDGTGGSVAYVPAPNTSKGTFAIYGEIAEGQTTLRPALYADSVSLTITLAP